MSKGNGREAMRDAIRRLSVAGVGAPARDVRLLLAAALDLAPDRLVLVEGDPLGPEAAARFAEMVAAREAAQPVAQIVGRRLFWGREFRVTRDVLDPRPETETLIALALDGSEPGRILDIGTGSGAILLTLLAEWPAARGLGTDRSAAALTVARNNAEALGLAGRATFAESDWFSDVDDRYDLVVCNPPYIPAADMAHLARDVRDWEPHCALTPGPTGLESYQRITAGLAERIAPGGRALFEIGADQGETVPELFRAAGFARVAVHADMDGRARVVSVGPERPAAS